MKTRTKVALTVLCALLLVTVSILGTLAYLTSKTDTVTNTFTVGKVSITLDEQTLNADGTVKEATRVTENKGLILVPGQEYKKDPTIHVAANSEDSYVFVKITNNLAGVEVADAAEAPTIAEQLAEKGWTQLTNNDVPVDGVYYYTDGYTKTATVVNIPVFDEFNVDPAKKAEDLAAFEKKTIEIVGYAIQKANVTDVNAAWAALNA